MKCNFLAGCHAFTFKIAYDEAYARYSPGVLIELFQMRHLRDAHPELTAVDSCTVADNTMFPSLWSGECVLVIMRFCATIRSTEFAAPWCAPDAGVGALAPGGDPVIAMQDSGALAVESPLYTTHPGDVTRDRDEILAVWQDHFGPLDIEPAKFDHFYRENPYGPAIIQLLRHVATGELVGVIGAGPRPFIWQGRPIRAAVVAHFAVDAHHRSLGPALMLQRSLIESARGQFDLLYGLPRPSAIGVSRRAGFSTLGTLVRHAKVLRHGEYLKRRLPGFVATPAGAVIDMGNRMRDGLAEGLSPRLQWDWVQASDARMDTLWKGSTHTDALTSVRDHALLRWRFDTPPAERARYLLVSGKDDRLHAWFACEERAGHGGPLIVMDYWSADAMSGIGHPLIRALISAANEQGCSAVHLLLTASDPAMAGWHAEGFVARSEQPMIGLWLDRQQAPEGTPKLHVTMVDQDG